MGKRRLSSAKEVVEGSEVTKKKSTKVNSMNPDNESKQAVVKAASERSDKCRKKKKDCESPSKANKQGKPEVGKSKLDLITETIEENDEVVDMEVEGQGLEFRSEEEESESESENEEQTDEIEDGELQDKSLSINNNATLDQVCRKGASNFKCDSRADTEEFVTIRKLTPEEESIKKQNELKEEEEFFGRFKKYMEWEGFLNLAAKGETSKDSREDSSKTRKRQSKGGELDDPSSKLDNVRQSQSETTIYQQAVRKANEASELNKRILEGIASVRDRLSSSSEEEEIINTSDESNDVLKGLIEIDALNIAGDRGRGGGKKSPKQDRWEEEPRPHCSRDNPDNRDRVVMEAERAKARIFNIPGKSTNNASAIDLHKWQTAMIDESYVTIGTHLDLSLRQKIESGGYVDLSRLLPRDKIVTEEDHRMEMVIKGGMTYWVPISDRELSSITSYIRWEQAFRVYMNIFSKAQPERVTELLQYNHTIEVASSSFQWDDVYCYDREFRIHMGEFPERNWGIILQQAWALYMRNPFRKNDYRQNESTSGMPKSGNEYPRKVCFKYNRGKCSFGNKCKFDHHCGICGKRGHGAFNCRKAIDFEDRKNSPIKG